MSFNPKSELEHGTEHFTAPTQEIYREDDFSLEPEASGHPGAL